MEKLIVEALENRSEIPMTSFLSIIPSIAGEFDFMFPSEHVSNVLLISGVNEAFMEAFGNLIEQKVISFKRARFEDFLFYNAPVYDLPIADEPKKYSQVHFLPLLVIQGENYTSYHLS